MRTIRRISRKVNKKKWESIKETAHRYGCEKDHHLIEIGSPRLFTRCQSHRKRRDSLVKEKYKSPYNLQARQWKMALKDAYETLDKQWLSCGSSLKIYVYQRNWNSSQKHYGHWLLKKSHHLCGLVCGKRFAPSHFSLKPDEYRLVRNSLRRKLQGMNISSPRVKKARSFVLDSDMYRIFEHKGHHYIKIMGLKPGERITIPLTGNTPIKGNIRVVIDDNKQRVEIHYTAKVKKGKKLKGSCCGVDAGVTEVFTDEENNRYGLGFGSVLLKASESLKSKGIKRNKLYQVKKKSSHKKKKVEKHNLGIQKRIKSRRKVRIDIERRINEAVNSFTAQT